MADEEQQQGADAATLAEDPSAVSAPEGEAPAAEAQPVDGGVPAGAEVAAEVDPPDMPPEDLEQVEAEEKAAEEAPVAAPVADATAAAQEGLSKEELEERRASEVAFGWQASEYVHHHKGIAWY